MEYFQVPGFKFQIQSCVPIKGYLNLNFKIRIYTLSEVRNFEL